jgi:ubiquinone/menaquinone biosynthesis C-methylase UbiE
MPRAASRILRNTRAVWDEDKRATQRDMATAIEHRPIHFHCLRCRQRLDETSDSLDCSQCKRRFSFLHGIPCLAEHSSEDSGDIGKMAMAQLFEDCEKATWQEAITRASQSATRPADFLEQAVSPCRASWCLLLNLQSSWRVLEINCGWGAQSFCVARNVAAVVACDLSVERLRFIRARAAQEGVSNIIPVCAGDTLHLPFADGEFDLILINADSAEQLHQGISTAVQASLLRETARVLVPKGQLILAAPNRPSLLFRLEKKGTQETAPGKSLGNYRRELRAAGFASSVAYIPLPNSRTFHAIVDPASKCMVARYFAESSSGRSATIKRRLKASLILRMAPSFCWVASRAGLQESFLDALGKQATQEIAGDSGRKMEWEKFRVTQREVVAAKLRIEGFSPSLLFKIPLSASAVVRIQQEHQTLESLQRIPGVAGDWGEIPKPLTQGRFRGVPYFIQTALPGLPGLRFLHTDILDSRPVRHAFDFIVRLHRATQRLAPLGEAEWDQIIAPHVESALGSLERQTNLRGVPIRDYILRALGGNSWPLVFSHGDFWPGNLLFGTRGELLGVIDWEAAVPHFLPLLDLLHCLLSIRAESERLAPTDLFGRVMSEGLKPAERRLVDEYAEKMNFRLSPGQVRAFVLLDWLLRISARVEPRQATWWCEQEWLRDNVAPSAKWLKEVLGENV